MVAEVEEKSEITTIPNRYKDTLNDLIDSSNIESSDWPNSSDRTGLINKGSCNTFRPSDGSSTLSKDDRLHDNISVTSLELMSRIQDFIIYQHHDVITFSPKSRRAQYRKGQRDRENRKGERGGEDHQRNKVDLVVGESSGSEASVYYHIIYLC